MAADRPTGNRYKRLLELGPFSLELEPVSQEFCFDIFQRWNLAADDPNATKTAKDLEQLWQTWTFEQKWLLLATAERIVNANAARVAWELDPGQKRRHIEIGDRCLAATRLARKLLTSFPQKPWKGDQAAIGELITSLVDFAVSGLYETATLDHHVAQYQAKRFFDQLKRREPKHQEAPNALIADLVWLASPQPKGESMPLNESTIRRFGRTSRRLPPSAAYWRKGWNDLVTTLRLLGDEPTTGSTFRQAFRRFLRGSSIQ